MLTQEMVSVRDYQGLDGFGSGVLATSEALEDLNKALGTTSAGGLGTTFTDGSALRVQSLEATLKVVTYQMEHVKFWKKLSKLPAYNTVEEYNRLDSYGSDVPAFFEEGGLPGAEDAQYSRQTGLVKFLGTTRSVTHPLTLIRPAHGDVIARETQNGTIWLLGKMEQALFEGNDTQNPLAFKGLRQLIAEGTGGETPTNPNVIDMRGQPLSEEALELGATIISDNYGRMTDLFLGVRAMGDLAKTFFPKERVGLPAPVNGKAGVPLTHFQAQSGSVEFNPDVFIRAGGAPKTAGDAGAPAAPVAPTAGSPVSDAASLFRASDAGAYYYKVSAVNYAGESLSTVIASAVTIGSGEKVTLTLTRVTSAPAATAYKIYRSEKNGAATTCTLVTTVADAGTGVTQTWDDKNWDLPGTSVAYGIDLDPMQVISFKQLAPLMKMPLATIAASVRFMILLYGVLQLYAPRKCVLYKNIGKIA